MPGLFLAYFLEMKAVFSRWLKTKELSSLLKKAGRKLLKNNLFGLRIDGSFPKRFGENFPASDSLLLWVAKRREGNEFRAGPSRSETGGPRKRWMRSRLYACILPFAQLKFFATPHPSAFGCHLPPLGKASYVCT